MQWAGSVQVGKGSHKAVLLALAWFHHEKKGECCRSIPSIVAWTELNRKTVIAAIDSLEKAGLISVEKRQGAANNYRLNFDSAALDADPEPVPETGLVPKTVPVPKTGLNQYQKRTKPVPKTVPYKVGSRDSVYNAREGISDSAVERWSQHLTALNRTLTAPILLCIETTLSNLDETAQQKLVDFAISGQYANLERAKVHFQAQQQKSTSQPRSRDTDITDDLTDTSWAVGIVK